MLPVYFDLKLPLNEGADVLGSGVGVIELIEPDKDADVDGANLKLGRGCGDIETAKDVC